MISCWNRLRRLKRITPTSFPVPSVFDGMFFCWIFVVSPGIVPTVLKLQDQAASLRFRSIPGTGIDHSGIEGSWIYGFSQTLRQYNNAYHKPEFTSFFLKHQFCWREFLLSVRPDQQSIAIKGQFWGYCWCFRNPAPYLACIKPHE